MSELDRRELLRQLALLGAGLSAAMAGCRERGSSGTSGTPPDAAPPSAAPLPSPYVEGARALLPPQRALLAATLARIIPTDRDPGAAEADVVEYVDRELARPEYAAVKGAVLAGLTALGRRSMRAAKAGFEALSAAEQDQILHETQRSGDRGKDFLFVVTVLAIEGFLGDPRWGGNKGGAGWRFIGYGPGTVSGETPEHGHH